MSLHCLMFKEFRCLENMDKRFSVLFFPLVRPKSVGGSFVMNNFKN